MDPACFCGVLLIIQAFVEVLLSFMEDALDIKK